MNLETEIGKCEKCGENMFLFYFLCSNGNAIGVCKDCANTIMESRLKTHLDRIKEVLKHYEPTN